MKMPLHEHLYILTKAMQLNKPVAEHLENLIHEYGESNTDADEQVRYRAIWEFLVALEMTGMDLTIKHTTFCLNMRYLSEDEIYEMLDKMSFIEDPFDPNDADAGLLMDYEFVHERLRHDADTGNISNLEYALLYFLPRRSPLFDEPEAYITNDFQKVLEAMDAAKEKGYTVLRLDTMFQKLLVRE